MATAIFLLLDTKFGGLPNKQAPEIILTCPECWGPRLYVGCGVLRKIAEIASGGCPPRKGGVFFLCIPCIASQPITPHIDCRFVIDIYVLHHRRDVTPHRRGAARLTAESNSLNFCFFFVDFRDIWVLTPDI